ncbi:MAG: replicative DNA helicase [Oscillatoria sp. SIO1A7]|nr:replicative DNA helicase [Oscillatoria sp. SIO1A7]
MADRANFSASNLGDASGQMRLPPQNIEAEEAILGGILLDPDAIGLVADKLPSDAFSITAHKTIYKAALALYAQGQPTDLMSATTWLADRSLLEQIGGQSKLAQLVDRTVSAVNIDQYAALVVDKWIRRQLIQAGHEIVELGYETETEIPIILDRAEQKIFGLTQNRPQSGLVPIADTLIETFQKIESQQEEGTLPGITCDFYDLDAMTGGFQRSDLVIVAGRPSMGKTSFALDIARRVADKHELAAAIFSLEMSTEQLVQRLLSGEAGIESNRLRSGRISQTEWEPLSLGVGTLSELPIYIDDTPNITITEMRSKCRRLQAEYRGELGLILLDYLQLMEGTSDNRVQELSRITRGLKGLARELNVPLIALSQLSRGVESRTNKRPMMSDLRESGCLAGETLIALADSGDRYAFADRSQSVPIRDLVGKSGFAVWAIDEKTMKLKPGIVSNAFGTGTKPVYKLTTREGRSIRATANHKFLTASGWKRLDELELGEAIALPQPSFPRWDEIVAIAPDGEASTYDLTVEGYHNFVANNIVAHNSIEQEADLIIMLYREEYYQPDTPDRGIAEIIITKHRNGPTGTVKLLFDSQLTKFKNYAKPQNY